MIVDEPHRLAGAQRVERAKDRGMGKALGDSARSEWIELVGGEMDMGIRVHGNGSMGKVEAVDGSYSRFSSPRLSFVAAQSSASGSGGFFSTIGATARPAPR